MVPTGHLASVPDALVRDAVFMKTTFMKTTFTNTTQASTAGKPANGLRPVLIDVGVPLAGYYVLTKIFGMDAVAALAWSSVVPAASALWGVARERRVHALAVLMLLANAAGLTLSLLTHDARLLLVKDSAMTCTFGLVLLIAVAFGRSLLAPAAQAALTNANASRAATWQHLRATSAPFRRAELLFSAVWGLALVVECVTRVALVFMLPVDTMVWLGPVLVVAMIVVTIAVSRRTSMEPMMRMLRAA